MPAIRPLAARLTPSADEIDHTTEFPRDLWPELGELGLDRGQEADA